MLLLAGCDRPTAPAEPVVGNVTENRVLAEADSGDHWLVNGGRFGGEHFSPQVYHITDIRLRLAWCLVAAPA